VAAEQPNADAKLIILTMHVDLSFVRAAFEAAVFGYPNVLEAGPPDVTGDVRSRRGISDC
jgi:hypothetical protein